MWSPGLFVWRLSWFFCDSPLKPGQTNVLVLVSGLEGDGEAYADLCSEASVYPQALALLSVPPTMSLKSGDYLSPGSVEEQTLVSRVENILLGASDETSWMTWSRGSQASMPVIWPV